MHANAKLQIFAPRAHEHVCKYILIRDRQRFGTTLGLRYFMKIWTDNENVENGRYFDFEGLFGVFMHANNYL